MTAPRIVLNFDGDLSEKDLAELKGRFLEATARGRPVALTVATPPATSQPSRGASAACRWCSTPGTSSSSVSAWRPYRWAWRAYR